MGNRRLTYQILVAGLYALVALGCSDESPQEGGYGYADEPIAVVKAAKKKVTVGAVIELDGAESYDKGKPPLPLRFHWDFLEIPAGSAAEFNQATLRNPSFIADLPGQYVIALVVDNGIWSSEQDDVTIDVLPCQPIIEPLGTVPEAPVAGTIVQVSANISEECGEQQPYQYKWAFSSLPTGSGAKLNDSAVVSPSFLADVEGDYVLTLVVIDTLGRRSEYLTLPVTVIAMPAVECGKAEPVAVVEPLWTDMSGDSVDLAAFKVGVGASVQLTGRGSTDADNDPACSLNQELFYGWRFIALPGGSKAVLNDAQIVNPSILADSPGDYVIGLTVMDSTGLVSKETIVTIKAGN